MTAHTRLDPPLVESIRKALTGNALPGETQGLSSDAERDAAEFLAAIAATRKRGELALAIESTGGEAGNRRMRIGMVNDDMPFLVEFVANALAQRQLTIHRLLHPVVCVSRDDKGALQAIELLCGDKSRRESMMYLELDRADARGRQELAADLRRVLERCAARGARLGIAAAADARGRRVDRRPRRCGVAQLVRRRGDDLARLSCREAVRAADLRARHLQRSGRPTDEGGALGAMRYLEKGGQVPLMAKAERQATVHRRVPLDLVVIPVRAGERSPASAFTRVCGPAKRFVFRRERAGPARAA